MREMLIAGIVGLQIIGIAIGLFFGFQLKKFLSSVKTIDSESDIDMLKDVVKKQMYAALIQMFILTAPAALFIYGVFSKTLVFSDILCIIIPSLVIIAEGMVIKKLEVKVQRLEATNQDLADERDNIVHIWLHKIFPGW